MSFGESELLIVLFENILLSVFPSCLNELSGQPRRIFDPEGVLCDAIHLCHVDGHTTTNGNQAVSRVLLYLWSNPVAKFLRASFLL